MTGLLGQIDMTLTAFVRMHKACRRQVQHRHHAWRDAIKRGVQLVTGARVSRLTMNDRGLVTGAECINRNGTWKRQAARVTVLAANGIGTPRLLLNSAPDGLANSSGLVGKRLMTHPYASVYGAYDEDMETWLGPAGEALQSLQFHETDTDRGFVRGAKRNLMPTGGPLAQTLWEPGDNWRDGFGANFHSRLNRAFGRYTESGDHHRGPARRIQHVDNGSRRHRLRRNPRGQDPLRDRRELPAHARVQRRAGRRGTRGRRSR